MYNRLDEIPVYERRQSTMPALYYNHVQQGLKYLGESIRFPIPRLRTLELILQKEAWIIVDNRLNDFPVAAWTEFVADHRDNLHEDIPCELRFYHQHAELVLERTLEAMELILGEQLDERLEENVGDKVVKFRGPSREP